MQLERLALEMVESEGVSVSMAALRLPSGVHGGMGRRPHSPACLQIVKDRNVLGPGDEELDGPMWHAGEQFLEVLQHKLGGEAIAQVHQ